MQCAGSRGVGESVKHRAASTWRGEDYRGRLGGVWWWRGLFDDAVAVLDAPHRLFDPLDDAFDAQSDRSGASGSALLVGGPAARLRAPQAWTTPTGRCGQLGTAARADGLIGHGDTLRQFRTDETQLPICDLNARGVWFVGWSETVDDYARNGGPQPHGATERRLREGYKVVRMLVDAYDDKTARAWLFGTNTRLDDRAPIEVLGAAIDSAEFALVIRAARQVASFQS
jgi:hypothetical protein